MPVCCVCNKRAYSEYCVAHKPRKPILKRGKRTIAYEKWRDEIAKPYLDQVFGRQCRVTGCFETENLHVDHIENRGSHPELKKVLSNVQYLCFKHHREKTDHL